MDAPRPRSDLQLAIGYWIVSHRQTLRRWWAIMFMAVMAVSLVWVMFFFSVFFKQDGRVNEQIATAASATGSFRTARFQPQVVTVGAVRTILRDSTHVDVVADITNPNLDWSGTDVTYHFTLDDAAQPAQHAFINQDSRRPVFLSNIVVRDATVVKAALSIDSMDWIRATAGGLPAPNFTVTNVEILPSTLTDSGQSRSSVTIKADVTNASVYNYYHVTIPIILESGDRAVGLGQVDKERWPTLTTRQITFTFNYPVTGVANVRIEPQINRFDTANIYR